MRDLTVPFPNRGAGSGCCRMTGHCSGGGRGLQAGCKLNHADGERSRVIRSL